MIKNRTLIFQKICIAVSIPFCFVLQAGVFSHFSLGGVIPNLLIILTVFYGILYGEDTGIWVGFFCGLLMDIFGAGYLGAGALSTMYLGYVCGHLCGLFYPDELRFPIGVLAVSEVSYGFLYYVFTFLLRGRTDLGFYMGHVILPETFYTICVGLVMYPLILKADKAFEEMKNRSEQTIV